MSATAPIMTSMGTLYVVATPIGNLQDLTPRALATLTATATIAAENTNTARRLLSALGLRGKRLVAYNEHNRRARIPVLTALLASEDVALVSEAGTPGISDPGTELVRAAREAGHRVEPIPGVSAPITALSVSGIVARTFTFIGFPPVSRREFRALLQRLALAPDAIVLLEAPHRLPETLAVVLDVLGDRQCFVGRELTKRFEEGWTGGLAEAIDHFAEPRGEFTLVVAGATPAPGDESADPASLAALLEGVTSAPEALERLETAGLSRREAYRAWLDHDRKHRGPGGGGKARR